MKVEFEYFKEPMPLNQDTINHLKKQGSYFFCHTRETRKQYNSKTYKEETVAEEKIEVLQIYPSVVLFGGDFFSFYKYENTVLLGVCNLEFPKGVQVRI